MYLDFYIFSWSYLLIDDWDPISHSKQKILFYFFNLISRFLFLKDFINLFDRERQSTSRERGRRSRLPIKQGAQSRLNPQTLGSDLAEGMRDFRVSQLVVSKFNTNSPHWIKRLLCSMFCRFLCKQTWDQYP